MALPQLTAEARTEALTKARAVRREQAEILGALKAGELSLRQVLDRKDPVVGKIRVRRLLEALPGIGKVRAEQFLAAAAISETRRVQGLGPLQRERLFALIPAGD